MPKRNTYHNRGGCFWAKQTEKKTQEEFWRRLIEIEKECKFNTISAGIKNYGQANERKDTRTENYRANKTDTHEKKNKKNTKPDALISSKEEQAIKEEPIQRMERFGTRPKKKNLNNRPFRYRGASNWSPLHKCPALEVNCNKGGKKGHYGKACRQKFSNNRTVKD